MKVADKKLYRHEGIFCCHLSKSSHCIVNVVFPKKCCSHNCNYSGLCCVYAITSFWSRCDSCYRSLCTPMYTRVYFVFACSSTQMHQLYTGGRIKDYTSFANVHHSQPVLYVRNACIYLSIASELFMRIG